MCERHDSCHDGQSLCIRGAVSFRSRSLNCPMRLVFLRFAARRVLVWFALAVLAGWSPMLRAQYVDLGFMPNPNNTVKALAWQPDGKLIIAGAFTRIATIPWNYLVRFSASGAPDPAFQPAISGRVEALALLPDGKILVGG